MKRIAYKKSDGCWVDNSGDRKDIPLVPDEENYYFVIDDLNLIFKCFDQLQNWSDILGVVYDFDGNQVGVIPAYVCPAYSGIKANYKSRVYWGQSYDQESLVFVVNSTELPDFRARFCLKKMMFIGFLADVR